MSEKIALVEMSPVNQGIKTKNPTAFAVGDIVEMSPVNQGIKTAQTCL